MSEGKAVDCNMSIEVVNFFQAVATSQGGGGAESNGVTSSWGVNLDPDLNNHFLHGAFDYPAGTYDIFLDTPLAEEEGFIFISPRAPCVPKTTFAVVDISETQKRVLTFVNGVLDDGVGFDILVCRRPGK